MNRRTHRLVAFVLMLGMLVAQMSVAAFACPLVGSAPEAPPMPAAHEGCSGHAVAAPASAPAPADTALCELHCQTAVTVPSTPAPPVALVAGAALVIPVADAAACADRGCDVRIERTAMATAPPVSIRYCRFQI